MPVSTKGQRIWQTVTEKGLEEVYEVAGQMPLKEGSKVVWHACSQGPNVMTMCGIGLEKVVDPRRLVDYARYTCKECRHAYGEADWDEHIIQTLAKVTELADRTNGSGLV